MIKKQVIFNIRKDSLLKLSKIMFMQQNETAVDVARRKEHPDIILIITSMSRVSLTSLPYPC